MPFLAPIGSALLGFFGTPAGAATIGAAGSLGAGLLAGRRPEEEKQAARGITESTGLARQFAQEFKPFALDFLRRGEETFDPVLNYYNRLLTGDRAAVTNLLAPEIRAITEGYGTARRTLGELTPRAGGTSALLADLPFRQAGDISSLIARARPAAVKALSTLGTNLTSLGTRVGGLTSGLLSGAAFGASPLLSYGLGRTQQQYGFGRDVGKTISDIVRGLGIGTTPSIAGTATLPTFPGRTEPPLRDLLPLLG